MSGKIENLPKWAQEEIRNLHDRVNSLTASEKQLREKAFDGSGLVVIKDYVGTDTILEDRASITMKVKNGSINIRTDGKQIYVMGETGVGISFSPSASNCGYLSVRDD